MTSLSSASRRRLVLVMVTGLLLMTFTPTFGASQSKNKGAETFRATARLSTDSASGDAHLTVVIDRYSSDRDIQAMEQALTTGGSDGFLQALRRAPVVGQLKAGDQTFNIRWARQRATANGRAISLVTDAPVYFVGGGVPGAKARSGFDVAVLQLVMDSSGIGEGVIAPAAKVKPGGETGVQVDDYASEPVKLVSVSLLIS